jgi:D-aminopeptidase
VDDGTAASDVTRVRAVPGGLRMDRPAENQSSVLHRIDGVPAMDTTGRYHCLELSAGLEIANAGGALYGAVSGFLGQGRMELLEPIAGDVWALPCPRALDHTPPGDWTLKFDRDAAGKVIGATVGCWLSRGLKYDLAT